MTDGIDDKICKKNIKFSAAAAGAAVAYFRLDRALPLPREVHYGLAGLVVALHCQNGLMTLPDMDELTSPESVYGVMAGIGGGFLYGFIGPRLGF
jgi:hypothetical protein